MRRSNGSTRPSEVPFVPIRTPIDIRGSLPTTERRQSRRRLASHLLTGDAYPPGATVENRVDIFRNGFTGGWFNTVYAKAHERGGHFGPWENPDAFIEGIRETFRLVRSQSRRSA